MQTRAQVCRSLLRSAGNQLACNALLNAAETLPIDDVQAGRRAGEREARRARAHETEQRVNKEIGTSAFRSKIAEYETAFSAKLRIFIKGALLGHEQVCLELISLNHQQRRHLQCAVTPANEKDAHV